MIPGFGVGGSGLGVGGGGPSSAGQTANGGTIQGPSIVYGNSSSLPTWLIVGGVLVGAYLIFRKKKK